MWLVFLPPAFLLFLALFFMALKKVIPLKIPFAQHRHRRREILWCSLVVKGGVVERMGSVDNSCGCGFMPFLIFLILILLVLGSCDNGFGCNTK